jgi:putative membrane protein
MSYLLEHWSADPFLAVVAFVVIWHEIGLARLARRTGPERAAERRRRSLVFYAGLAVLLLTVCSPLEYWADQYFFVHMIQHLLLMFAAPSLVVLGAPWQPLLDGLPGRLGRSADREELAARWPGPLRRVGSWLAGPWVAIAAFNAVMVAWHLPAALDLAVRHQAVAIWLLHSTYFLAGVAFFVQFIPSPPLRLRMSAMGQIGALLLTNIIMWVLAMSMGILTSHSWYSVYNHIPGVTLPAFADQQIGAGILWVCGDFWAVPLMISVVRRLIAEDGSVGSALDKLLHRETRRYQWADRR